MNVLILYFSGTGNTKAVAEEFYHALVLRDYSVEVHSMEDKFNPAIYPYDFLIVGFPKYYEYPVLYALDYLDHNLKKRGQVIPTLAYCTQAGHSLTDFSGLERLLRKKNHRLITSKSFPYANNLLIFSMFGSTTPEVLKENKRILKSQIDPLLDDFFLGKECKERVAWFRSILYHFTAVVFTKFMPIAGMKYSSSEECIGCKICACNCPKKNIKMVQNKPVFGRKCIFCMRCINACPVNAILYKGKKCAQYLEKGE